MEVNLKSLQKLVLKNFGFKFVSFIAAVALWSGFVGRGYILDVEVGINYLIPTNYTLRSSPDYVKIKLKGPEMAMKKFSRKNRTLDIDLSGRAPGVHHIPVTRDLLGLPPGVNVLSIRPEILNLEMVNAEGVTHGQ